MPKTYPTIVIAALSVSAVAQVPTVTDVIHQFNGLKHHAEWMGFLPVPAIAPPPIPTDHLQGIARHPDPATHVFYLSQSNTTGAQLGDAGQLLVVALDSRDLKDGVRMRSNRLSGAQTSDTAPLPADRVVNAVAINDYGHPGGMQACGNYLAVPVEHPNDGGPTAKILFFDISEPRHPRRLPFEISNSSHNLGVVGLTQLADGSYFMVATWGDNSQIEFLKSQPNDITTLAFYDSLPGGNVLGYWPIGGLVAAHQSLNFVTDTNGALFLIGTHNTSNASPIPLGEDWAILYHVNFVPNSTNVNLVQVASKHMYMADLTAHTGSNGNFAAAAGTYVSPTGELLLYATTHAVDYPSGPWVGMSEFRHHLYREDRRGGPCTAFVELYQDDHFGGRSFIFDSLDAYRENWANFGSLDDETLDTETGFHDQASSVVWNLPAGTFARLYENDTYGGKYLQLNGNGQTQIIEDLSTIGWTSGSGNPGDKISSIRMFESGGQLPARVLYVPTGFTPSVAQAVSASDGGPCAVINLGPQVYNETMFITKQLELRALGGPVLIGRR